MIIIEVASRRSFRRVYEHEDINTGHQEHCLGHQSDGIATFLAGSERGRVVTGVVTYYPRVLQVFYRNTLAVFNTKLLIP
jgi:hypothetical protein